MPTPFIIFLVLAVIAIIVTVAAKLIHHRNRDQRDADEMISPAGCWPGGSVITGVKKPPR
jgi:p-aminobenzoyl-glutamate transporter AbgT